MMRLPKTVPIPAPDPATPTVAAPAPMNLAAVSMSRWAALVRRARGAPGHTWGTVQGEGGVNLTPAPPGPQFPPWGTQSLPRMLIPSPGTLPAPAGPRGCSAPRPRGAGPALASSSSPAGHTQSSAWGDPRPEPPQSTGTTQGPPRPPLPPPDTLSPLGCPLSSTWTGGPHWHPPVQGTPVSPRGCRCQRRVPLTVIGDPGGC